MFLILVGLLFVSDYYFFIVSCIYFIGTVSQILNLWEYKLEALKNTFPSVPCFF